MLFINLHPNLTERTLEFLIEQLIDKHWFTNYPNSIQDTKKNLIVLNLLLKHKFVKI